MAVNKVVYNNRTLIDLTRDTVIPAKLAKGYTAHNAAGDSIVGTMAEYKAPIYIYLEIADSEWTLSNGRYHRIIYNSSITSTSIQVVTPPVGVADNELEAIQAANIQDGGQTNGSMTLAIYGKKPTIVIPLRIAIFQV